MKRKQARHVPPLTTKIPNHRHQTPGKSNNQTQKDSKAWPGYFRFGSLEFTWDLGFAIWSFCVAAWDFGSTLPASHWHSYQRLQTQERDLVSHFSVSSGAQISNSFI
jgi:hypothetical protein